MEGQGLVKSLLLFLVVGVGICAAFKIAAFNANDFGAEKMEDPDFLGFLIETIQRYDIILLQEIKDREEEAIYEVRHIINDAKHMRYGVRLSERVGRSKKSKEQYAFFFRKDTGIDMVDTMQYDDGLEGKCFLKKKDGKTFLNCPDTFEREPFIVRVNSEKTLVKDFALIAVHIRPDDAINELNHLPEVVDQVMEKWGVKNVMILGDLNADCDYLKDEEMNQIKMWTDPNYTWFIDDEEDTTVTDTNCALDRFIVRGQELLDAIVPGSAKVFDFLKEYNFNQTTAEAISDHYPIEIALRMADGSVEQETCGGGMPTDQEEEDGEVGEEDDGDAGQETCGGGPAYQPDDDGEIEEEEDGDAGQQMCGGGPAYQKDDDSGDQDDDADDDDSPGAKVPVKEEL